MLFLIRKGPFLLSSDCLALCRTFSEGDANIPTGSHNILEFYDQHFFSFLIDQLLCR